MRDQDLEQAISRLKVENFEELAFGLYFTSISDVASNFVYIRFSNRMKISLHGVQIDKPSVKDRLY